MSKIVVFFEHLHCVIDLEELCTHKQKSRPNFLFFFLLLTTRFNRAELIDRTDCR